MRRLCTFEAMILWILAALTIDLPLRPTTMAQSNQEVMLLEPGRPIEREMAGGQSHFYQLTLTNDQFLHLRLEQRGIDVVVSLFGPDGQKVFEVDSPNGRQGPEPVLWIAQAPGNYRLEAHSWEKAAVAGRYEVRIVELRPATRQDKTRVAAERAYAEGEQLRLRGTEVSLGQSIEKFEKALPLRRILNDTAGEAITLFSLGKVYSALGEKQKALDYYLASLPLRRALGDRDAEAFTLNNIGLIYDGFGEKQKALDYYQQTLPLYSSSGDRVGEARTRNNIGLLYFSLGETRRALDYYNQSLPVSRALGDRFQEAITLHNIALAHNSLGEVQKALDYYSQALGPARAIGDRRLEGLTLNNLGGIYKSLGEKQKALEYFNQALGLHRTVGDRHREAITLQNLGFLHNGSGEKEKALDYFGQALSLFRAVGDRAEEANTLFGIARVERDRDNLRIAHAQMQASLDLIESLRSKVISRELRASFFAEKRHYYEFEIALQMRLHERYPAEGFAAAALQTSERARARSLLESLTEARVDIRQGIDPALLGSEHSLQQRLNAKEQERVQLLSRKHTPQQAETIEREIRALSAELQQIQSQIRANSPHYAALTEPVPLNLGEIQQQTLDANTLLLEYALGKEHSYLWAVSQNSIASFELPVHAEIEAAARRFYDMLLESNQPSRTARSTPGARASGNKQALAEAAARLSKMLLAPLAPHLGNKRLLIVADGALQYVPFAALPAPDSGGAGEQETGKQADQANPQSQSPNPQTLIPLIARHEIVNLPSASTLAILRRETATRPTAPRDLAVLADPVFDRNDPRVQLKLADDSNAQPARHLLQRALQGAGISGVWIPRLPGTRREAAGILALLPETQRKQALDFDASRATLTSAELSQYRVIHLATHGLLNSADPELSGLVLSLVDEQGQSQDGFLRLHEIYNLRLPAELVVLSACQTALGKEIRGEGLVGLTRGFMYAGAPRVVASLWKVDDRATAELMKLFYQGMLGQDRLRPAAALRAAQIAMWKTKRWEEPYYWAAFVFQGEWR